MANRKEANDFEIDFHFAANGLLREGSTIREQEDDQGVKSAREKSDQSEHQLEFGRPIPIDMFAAGSMLDPEKVIRRVNHQLKKNKRVSAETFLRARAIQEEIEELDVDPLVLEVLIEEQGRGIVGGSGQNRVENLPLIPPEFENPIEEDDDSSGFRL